MKQLSTLCLLLISAAVLAQQPGAKRFSMGAHVSVGVHYHYTEAPENTTLVYSNLADWPKLGYRAGVNLFYSIKPHWQLESGLAFSNRGFGARQIRSGENRLATKDVRVYSSFYALDVPLRLAFDFERRNIQWVLIAGASANIYLGNQKITYRYYRTRREKTTTTYDDAFNPVALSPELGLGACFPLGNTGKTLRLAPTFSYQLFDGTRRDLWSAGVETTIKF